VESIGGLAAYFRLYGTAQHDIQMNIYLHPWSQERNTCNGAFSQN